MDIQFFPKSRVWIFSFLAILAEPAVADQLTIYAYPSPLGIDWTNPATLTWSAVLNSLVQDDQLHAIHSIGHMNFHLQCSPSAQLPSGADIETGQTNSDDSQMNEAILDDDYGLGAVVTDYSGVWEVASDIEDDLTIRYQRGSVAFMDIAIAPSSCARVVQYLTEYQARGLDKIYGGLERKAREAHGSGCSSFAESVLEIAGIMAPEWQSDWAHTVNMEWSLIGGPLTGNDVSILDMFFSPESGSWGTPADSDVVNFWDPYLAFTWIQAAATHVLPLTGMTYTATHRDIAKGVMIDATQLPTPTDSFWIP